MIGFLDTLRHTLDELSPELGVTDPHSGTVVGKIRKEKQWLNFIH